MTSQLSGLREEHLGYGEQMYHLCPGKQISVVISNVYLTQLAWYPQGWTQTRQDVVHSFFSLLLW